MATTWQELATEKKRKQKKEIPKEWLIQTPPDDVLDVSRLPEECGLLSRKELEITNATVDILLERLAFGVWSSVEVTTAFYKRAIVAHQLVRLSIHLYSLRVDFTNSRPTV
jgi:amidase